MFLELLPIPKPRRRSGQDRHRSKWSRFRKKFLEGQADWEGYYTCRACKGKFKEIDIDHIVKRSLRPDLIFVEENLQLLCRPCHIEKDGGFKKVRRSE